MVCESGGFDDLVVQRGGSSRLRPGDVRYVSYRGQGSDCLYVWTDNPFNKKSYCGRWVVEWGGLEKDLGFLYFSHVWIDSLCGVLLGVVFLRRNALQTDLRIPRSTLSVLFEVHRVLSCENGFEVHVDGKNCFGKTLRFRRLRFFVSCEVVVGVYP